MVFLKLNLILKLARRSSILTKLSPAHEKDINALCLLLFETKCYLFQCGRVVPAGRRPLERRQRCLVSTKVILQKAPGASFHF